MDTVCCKYCQQISSVTPNTLTIRCWNCTRIFSVSNNIEETDVSSSCGSSRCNFLGLKASRRSSSSMLSIKELKPPKSKRALLCGVSYKGLKVNLKGTTQDVLNMKALLLQKFKFSEDAILILAEEERFRLPTRENILDGFDWLTKNTHETDSLLFYYSGHGLRKVDLKEEEIDGFDEFICPVDFKAAGVIIDNEINEKLVQRLKKGVTLHAIVDSCHSGTVLDLPHVYNRAQGRWVVHPKCKGTAGGTVVCFSACEDYQLATSTSIFSTDQRTVVGTMTYLLIQAVMNKKNGSVSYRDILDHVHKAIEEDNRTRTRGFRRFFRRQILQDPILSSSREFDIRSEFKL